MKTPSFVPLALCLTLASLSSKAVTRPEFRIRDPFVLTEGGTYYLYESKPWNGGRGVDVRTSKDLDNWSERTNVMTVPEGVSCSAVWAPEVHKYKGRFYLLTTLTIAGKEKLYPMTEKGFTGGTLCARGVWVFASDSPVGPFKPVKMGPVTPPGWMCLDGTLWVQNGKPWMVFCHEWCQTGNGRMMAVPLKADLSAFAGEPIELFRAANTIKGSSRVTDGPFLIQAPDNGLWMIWSNFLEGSGYCVIACKSETGLVTGPWSGYKPIYRENGGHGMLFHRFDGTLMLTLHQPNKGDLERMRLFEMKLTGDGPALASEGGR